MKILLQSTLFYPSVGGVETVTERLASLYTELGHECIVLTRSKHDGTDNYPFKVIRNPSWSEKIEWIQYVDIIHCNGASIELVVWAKAAGKPIVWTHQSYLLQAIDGLGWVEGEKAPLQPWNSFLYHSKRFGFFHGLKEGLKLGAKRYMAKWIDMHVAITHWVAKRQPQNRQIVIYNPFPINRFSAIAKNGSEEYDFFFLGRLVSEKGVETLIKAFSEFLKLQPKYSKKLLLIGDGNWRQRLEKKASELQIYDRITFAGRQTGEALLEWVAKGKIAIIPSDWEEPMGGVALEMLAAEKLVIVSANGGLAECVGHAGVTFPNQDHKALALQMNKLYNDLEVQQQLKVQIPLQLAMFDEKNLAQQYIQVFEKLLKN